MNKKKKLCPSICDDGLNAYINLLFLDVNVWNIISIFNLERKGYHQTKIHKNLYIQLNHIQKKYMTFI